MELQRDLAEGLNAGKGLTDAQSFEDDGHLGVPHRFQIFFEFLTELLDRYGLNENAIHDLIGPALLCDQTVRDRLGGQRGRNAACSIRQDRDGPIAVLEGILDDRADDFAGLNSFEGQGMLIEAHDFGFAAAVLVGLDGSEAHGGVVSIEPDEADISPTRDGRILKDSRCFVLRFGFIDVIGDGLIVVIEVLAELGPGGTGSFGEFVDDAADTPLGVGRGCAPDEKDDGSAVGHGLFDESAYGFSAFVVVDSDVTEAAALIGIVIHGDERHLLGNLAKMGRLLLGVDDADGNTGRALLEDGVQNGALAGDFPFFGHAENELDVLFLSGFAGSRFANGPETGAVICDDGDDRPTRRLSAAGCCKQRDSKWKR